MNLSRGGLLWYACQLVIAASVASRAFAFPNARAPIAWDGAVSVRARAIDTPDRSELRVSHGGLVTRAVWRRSSDGPDVSGAVSIDRPAWRVVAGGYQHRALSGLSSGQAPSASAPGAWRVGWPLAASISTLAPQGVAAGWRRGGLNLSASVGRTNAGPGRRGVWAAGAGLHRGPLQLEVAGGRVRAPGSPLRLEVGLAVSRTVDGVAAGLSREGGAAAVHGSVRRRIGAHRLVAMWQRRIRDDPFKHPVFGVPRTVWGVRYRAGPVEFEHGARPGEADGTLGATRLRVYGQNGEMGWRIEVRRRRETGGDAIDVRASLSDQRDDRSWWWRLTASAESRAADALSSLLSAGVGGRFGRAGSIEVVHTFAHAGGFWTAWRDGVLTSRPIFLGAGETFSGLRLRWGDWELFGAQRDGSGGREIWGGLGFRWRVMRERGS
jgi:hypothetical protein